ncbi:MAG: hypothetical protein IPL01_16485 [Acidobacteria bacterium]|nr:hypothetical protein [Acidobacteriota bacterium]
MKRLSILIAILAVCILNARHWRRSPESRRSKPRVAIDVRTGNVVTMSWSSLTETGFVKSAQTCGFQPAPRSSTSAEDDLAWFDR